MNTLTITQSAVIDAAPQKVYGVIADYHVGHRAILPQPYFEEMSIVQGGHGAGTELRLRVKLLGQTYHYHQMVSEPEPGHVIKERDIETGQFTTFTFDPMDNGKQTQVTIKSVFPVESGIAGLMQRLVQPAITRRLYRQELGILADYVAGAANRQSKASGLTA